jgi:hypothetical protein
MAETPKLPWPEEWQLRRLRTQSFATVSLVLSSLTVVSICQAGRSGLLRLLRIFKKLELKVLHQVLRCRTKNERKTRVAWQPKFSHD